VVRGACFVLRASCCVRRALVRRASILSAMAGRSPSSMLVVDARRRCSPSMLADDED